MRFPAFAALILIVAILPLSAHAGVIVGGFNCSPQLPSDLSDPSFPPVSQLIASTSACVVRNITLAAASGIFDESAGLDANGCLSTSLDAVSVIGSSTVTPQCCVKTLPAGRAVMHCDVVSR